ncbi:hypothetical protein D8B26_002296 [Coccidioides posadasii str. Silveira]|uniref:Uncharacterized protein n=1 Tax=Coccidioides posadasii (strain RMSCC 757 / Silveira) TaxID=443226 RepID=E9DD81_COCPS|nr:hypothetical protein CPSG_08043 [Coccidioides posadasii str. Silveira]QVM07599.1 hypothetical protein D8B26_002296 [Coccidioides posadasii str. Silveira]
MSVLRGGSFFQRRLTKLYTDTKSSCESVSTAARPNDDPELISLNRSFRTQKDRLLAWGLDWSDASAAQPNDIDEALAEAGFSDVVASIMSSIQGLLNEAERLQQPDIPKSSPDGLTTGVVKTTWTDNEISRSKALLDELTSHIDTLYDLSRSRRNMTMSISSNTQSQMQSPHSPYSPRPEKSTSKRPLLYPVSLDSKIYPEKHSHLAKRDIKGGSHFSSGTERFAMSSLNLHVDTSAHDHTFLADEALLPFLSSTKEYYINRKALYLSSDGATHAPNPPPYEPVAASANSRVTGQLHTSAIPAPLAEGVNALSVPILVEFSPILMEMQNSPVLPKKQRLDHLSQTLKRLVENARVSHLGLLKFLGYFVDMAHSRYAFVYQMPTDIPSLPRQPSYPIQPKPLVSLLLSGIDPQDTPVPNLEIRFRLAYSLVLAVLHMRSQNLIHGNLNSNNILIFPGVEVSNTGAVDNFPADFRHPYLTSPALFDSEDKNSPPEPLSSSMYRHPDDRRIITDQSAWAYDLYSLGLVLLEIGLWTPISRLWKMKYTNAMFKSRIENVYIKKLGAKCGGAYLQTVQLCLDAPNFHLSTSPMEDLSLRVPQTYHYPWNEPSKANEWDTFSKNFLYTVGKVTFRCCSLDIVAPPPDTDLEESLPPPLSLDLDASSFQEVKPQDLGIPTVEPVVPINIGDDTAPLTDRFGSHINSDNTERRVRKRTLKKWSNLEIPDDHLQAWNKILMPKLSKLLQKILKDSNEPCSVSLMIAGESAETAKTTICVTCTSVRRVKAALKKYFEYDRENWDLIVIRGNINRSKVPRRRRKKAKSSKTAEKAPMDLNPHYQQRPICGASIGAFRSDEHLPPVSYGGAILVDGLPYGMTVHHMLDSPCDDDEEYEDNGCPPRSSGNYTPHTEMQDQDFAYSWCDDVPPQALYPFEISDSEGADDQSIAHSIDETYDDYWLSDSYSSDEAEDVGDFDIDDDTASIGDTEGVDPQDEPRIIVTQPALDDVEDGFFPTPEDRDDEHLASHSLGYVHASSGLRRTTRDGIKHEVDWALIKIDSDRLDATNVVPFTPSASSSSHPHSANIAPSNSADQPPQHQFQNLTKVARLDELGGLYVQCCGRTSGFQSGRISKAMTLVRLPGRQSFSLSFCVDGNFGVPGDSGAWVFNQNGQVCGHVLAWSEKSRTAYIAPMEILLDDIARTLGANSVALPGSEEELAWHGAMAAATSPYVNVAAATTKHSLSVVKDQLPLDLRRLNLDHLDEPSLARQTSGQPTAPGGRNATSSTATSAMKDVPVSGATTYRGINALISHPRTMEHQLA